MNKAEFIDWIVLKYMSNVDADQAHNAKKDLADIIPDGLDFVYMRESILKDYNKRGLPDYTYLKQFFREKTSNNFQWTYTTWDIYGKAKNGYIYNFANYMSVPEQKGIEIFKKNYPNLKYIGNNRQEIENYLREYEKEAIENRKKEQANEE